jgi:hypothetical protein
MKNGKFLGGMASWAFLVLVSSGLNAGAASVTMNVDDYTSYSTATSDYVGIYQFNVTTADPGTLPLGNFWSVCLSPNGTLSGGIDPIANAYTYNYQDFNTAATGLNGPAPWAGSSAGNAGYGIQNAQYLWSVFGSASKALSGTTAQGTVGTQGEQGAGLAAAMYVALYDSTAIGTCDINAGGKYNPITALNLDANVQTDMNADLSLLNQPDSSTLVLNHEAVGFVLDPVSPDPGGPSGQEFIILASNTGNVTVPEPASSGTIAGAFMLVAVIGSAFRRKKA